MTGSTPARHDFSLQALRCHRRTQRVLGGKAGQNCPQLRRLHHRPAVDQPAAAQQEAPEQHADGADRAGLLLTRTGLTHMRLPWQRGEARTCTGQQGGGGSRTEAAGVLQPNTAVCGEGSSGPPSARRASALGSHACSTTPRTSKAGTLPTQFSLPLRSTASRSGVASALAARLAAQKHDGLGTRTHTIPAMVGPSPPQLWVAR